MLISRFMMKIVSVEIMIVVSIIVKLCSRMLLIISLLMLGKLKMVLIIIVLFRIVVV